MKQFKEIFEYDKVTSFTKINKGWSSDSKYIIKMKDGSKRVLRVNDITQLDNKKKEYYYINKIYDLGIKTHKCIHFGVCDTNKKVYILLEYIEGDQAELILPSLNENEKYELGLEMGIALKKIHKIDYRKTSNWEDIYTKKIHSRIEAYRNCGYQSEKIEKMITYLLDNTHLLKNRPMSFNHGDFHSGNMIITPNKEIYVIDYNRIKEGDPFYEFNRIYFSYIVSPLFTKGMLDSYFENLELIHFKYIKFYLISVVIANIAWAMKFSEEDINFAKESINRIFDEYENLIEDIPRWYKNLVT